MGQTAISPDVCAASAYPQFPTYRRVALSDVTGQKQNYRVAPPASRINFHWVQIFIAVGDQPRRSVQSQGMIGRQSGIRVPTKHREGSPCASIGLLHWHLSACWDHFSRRARKSNTDRASVDPRSRSGRPRPIEGQPSAYGTLEQDKAAYVRMINERGGINGRKITLISLDDGYSPPKTIEQTRRLVEQDHVLGIFDSLGTAPNAAIQEYLNEKHVPHFAISGASSSTILRAFRGRWAGIASYETEGRIYAKYILQNIKDAKIGVLYQNDDLGKDYLKGDSRRSWGSCAEHDRQGSLLRAD